jgi:5-formyltetrahydrofolate cyclo-ligase
MPKKSIRATMLGRRKHLSAETCLGWSLKAQEHFLQLPLFADAEVLGLYSPVWNEVFTEEIFRSAREAGKRVAYPRIEEHGLEFVEVTDLAELGPGAFGVLEPRGARSVPLTALDLVVVPGVAFDLAGFRLGYGKGFYDRALSCFGRRAPLVGLCYELQMVDALPAESHDVRVDLVATEERTLRFRG